MFEKAMRHLGIGGERPEEREKCLTEINLQVDRLRKALNGALPGVVLTNDTDYENIERQAEAMIKKVQQNLSNEQREAAIKMLELWRKSSELRSRAYNEGWIVKDWKAIKNQITDQKLDELLAVMKGAVPTKLDGKTLE